MLDLKKYLAMKPQIIADIELAKKEVELALAGITLAREVHESALNALHNLETVLKMLTDLETNTAAAH